MVVAMHCFLRIMAASFRASAGRWRRLRRFFLFTEEVAEALYHIKGHGYEKDSDYRGGEHPSDDHCSQHLARDSARAGGYPQRHTAQDKSEGSHQDWAQSQSCASQGRFEQRLPAVVLNLGKFHDEDGILRRQTDQHDQTNLGVHVIFKVAKEEREESPEHCDRNAQQHAERQRPALVLCRHNEEDDEECQTKNDGGRHPLRSPLLLVRHTRIVEAHLTGHRLVEDILQCSHRLSRAVSWRRRSIDLYAVEEVVAHDELRAVARIRTGKRAQGNHIAGCIPDVKLAEIFRVGPEITIGLNVYLPLQTKTVEEVNQRTAHECLHSLIKLVRRNLLGHRLGVIYLHSNLGHVEQGGG